MEPYPGSGDRQVRNVPFGRLPTGGRQAGRAYSDHRSRRGDQQLRYLP